MTRPETRARRTAASLAAVAAVLLGTPPSVAAPPDPPPGAVRVVVLDKSSSMDVPDRLPVALKEIRAFAAQLPPDPRAPLVLVEFTDAATVTTFTDPAALDAHLTGVRADGGTRIAAGLKAAREQLGRYPAVPAVVLLFTDGEDADAAGIGAEEKALDGLFADRSRRGVNDVIACKRWENANFRLVEHLKAGGHARVIDAETLTLRPVTYRPAVEVVRAEWAADERAVVVDFRARVTATGDAGSAALPPALFVCETPGATGDGKQAVPPGGGPGVTFRRRVRVSDDQVLAGAVPFAFRVTVDPPRPADATAIVPVVAECPVAVRVPLPAVDCRIVSSAAAKPARWHDPLARVAAVPVDLTVRVTTSQAWTWDAPVEFTLQPDAGGEIVEGPKVVSVRGAGGQAVRLVVAVPVGPTATEVRVGLGSAAKSAAPGVRWLASSGRLDLTAPVPPPVVTTLTLTPRAPAATAWADVAAGTAAVEAEVSVKVDGPIPPGAELRFAPPAGVSGPTDRVLLRPGEQAVRLAFSSPLTPDAPAALTFRVIPPPPAGAVTFLAHPLTVPVTGPPAARLGLADAGGPVGTLGAAVGDAERSVTFRVTPVLLDGPALPPGRGLDVDLTPNAPFGPRAAGAGLDGEVELTLAVPVPADQSFWRDAEVTGELTVTPRSPGAAVRGSVYPVVVRVEAPFKRYAFYAVAGLALLATVWGAVAAYGRVTAPVDDARPGLAP